MLFSLLYVALGFVVLMLSADKFIAGSSAVARHLGVPPLVVGLTVVAIGTSLPEMFVSLMAALNASPELALGNAIGSNITNIAAVIGISSLIRPIILLSETLARELPLLLAVSGGVGLLLLDQHVSRADGLLLLGSLVVIIVWMCRLGLQARDGDPMLAGCTSESKSHMKQTTAYAFIVAGMLIMPLSSRVVVVHAAAIAEALGISQLVIGLTVVAFGTSLPELAASIAGILRGEDDLAIGNVIGSNIFNLLGVLGLPALIHPFAIDPIVLSRDYLVMMLLTFALFLMSYHFGRHKPVIYRIEGLGLVVSLGLYYAILYLTTS